jgi:hypothetical protein
VTHTRAQAGNVPRQVRVEPHRFLERQHRFGVLIVVVESLAFVKLRARARRSPAKSLDTCGLPALLFVLC